MIFTNSRYTNVDATLVDGVTSFKLRKRISFNTDGAKVHHFCLGDRLDGIAMTYYKSPQLWWVILEANPQYRAEFEIPLGADLVIPSYDEVVRCLKL